ncbi:uncharacterized protein J8A68_002573 [[Candida] subhashii]|uniref:WAC domain-containing protein n=1 Tax=[Candida] subhashii TaxID=561895 RepID=A0A8J5QP02_9ASCO|nr:uncharacterized protein J8A68_002573 [[Candida] subhashii]KAG7663885.1 hypothetical protein J8A68_002573 [[Candida] subhashii]
MVLYKRKQVKFIPPPSIPEDLSTEVWYIPQTKEWFLTYDEYLSRLDYYKKRKFVCEITGNSCLTFFEAYESELKEIEGVEKNFPESLREHILRFLQFNRITRLDQLVDKVYSVFKNDYFPGETIYIKGLEKSDPLHRDIEHNSSGSSSSSSGSGSGSSKQRGIIREKVQYGQTAQTKYLVVRLNDNQQAIVTNENISRDRNHFTKWLIKTFIKLTMSRSHKVGAPWVVKTKYAEKYRIPQTYPEDLKHFADSTPTGEILYQLPKKSRIANINKSNTPSSTPTPNPTERKKKIKEESKKKTKQPTPGLEDQPITPVVPYRKKFPLHYLPEKLQRELEEEEQLQQQQQQQSQPPQRVATPSLGLSQLQPTKKNIVDDLELKFDLQNPRPRLQALTLPENAKTWNAHLVAEFNDTDSQKEDEDQEDDSNEIPNKESEIRRLSSPHLNSIQDALQAWTFINIYHTVLNIDTFTFDDFVYCMGWNLDQYNEMGRCELLDEIWCAVLSAIVSNQIPTNKEAKEAKENEEIFGLNITLPERSRFEKEDDEEDEDEKEDDEDVRGSESEDEGKVLKIEDEDSTNEDSSEDLKNNGTKNNSKKDKKQEVIEISSQTDDKDGDADDEKQEDSDSELSMVEIEDEDDQKEDEEDDSSDTEYSSHNAYICMNYRNTPWHDRLRKRNFKDGNWQCILLGVLSLVEFVPQYKPIIEQVYNKLAPKTMPATPATVLNQFYEELDIDLKFQTLNILIDLIISSPLVRTYIDECLEASTSLRRTRLDNIKDYKQNLEIAQKANQFIFEKLKQKGEEDKRPRLNYSSIEMTEPESKLAETDLEFKQQCEIRKEALIKLNSIKKDKKAIEQKLTELDCQRVKLLGKDRLFNRYWWFENNGLPNLHAGANDDDENEDGDDAPNAKENANDDEIDEDKEEVSDETYLMGRLWVQGPSNDDLLINFNCDFNAAQKFKDELREREYHDRINHIEVIDLDEDNSKQKTQQQPPPPESATTPSEPKQEEPSPKKNQIREMNFIKFPNSFKTTVHTLHNLDFRDSEIFNHQKELIIDNEGSLLVPPQSLTPLQRKIIEESPDPLMNGSDWRYYDHPEDITKLITWLNPWGKRESNLRKELGVVKDSIIANIEARRKALWMDDESKLQPEEIELETNIRKLTERLEKLRAENDGVIEIDDDEGDESEDVQQREQERSDDDDGDGDDDEVVEIGSKRRMRSRNTSQPPPPPAKKQRRKVVQTVEDALEFGEEDDLVTMIEKLKEEFEEKREERELTRVVQWMNSKAEDRFGKSLYDGGERLKTSGKRKK